MAKQQDRKSNRSAKHLGELGPLFLTQQELCEYFKLIESHYIGPEVDVILDILSQEAEEVLGSFFRGFLVKMFSRILDAFVLVPIYNVRPVGDNGQLVEVRMHKRDGSIVQIWCCSKDLWPTHSPFQARASKNLHDTLHSGDLQYVVAMTEMHGYQYLFPINPRTTRLRKVLLRRLAELSELRRKEATCAELSKQADAVMEKLDLADRDLQLINVGGQFRVPGEAEKDAVWARKDELETEHKRLIEAIYNVGYDDRDIQANLRQIEHLVLNMKKLLQEGNQQAQAAARRSPRGCRPSSILFRPQDPQRQVGLPGAAGLRESETNSPIGGCDSLHAAKRPRLQAAEGDQAVQEGSSALSTQLQLQYLQAQADLLMLLCCNKVISHDGTEDWGKLDREAHSRASQLECYCQDLEAQLRAKGQAVPDQVQVARHYAMMVYEQRQLHAQGLPHRGTNPEQAPGPGQQHVLLRQDDTNSRASPARACESEQESCQRQQQQQAPHDGLGHGMSSHLPYHPAQPRHRVPPVKWKGAIALGQNGAVEKLLRTGRLQAERMQSCGSSRSSITDLKNTWIPLVFPLLEAVPDLKDLIPEVGLLTFEDERELASMVDFARRQGWYADRVSSGVACGKSALIFNDGYLAHQEMSVYVLTHKSQWAQETFLDQLQDMQKQLFLADKAFLLLFRLGPPKRPNATMPPRSTGVRSGPNAVGHVAAPGVRKAPVTNSTGPTAAAGSTAIAMRQAPGMELPSSLCPGSSECILGTGAPAAASGSMPGGVAATVAVPPQAEV